VAASPVRTERSNNNDGDVSSLISSDSESDEDVLQPVFKSAAAAAAVSGTSPRRSVYSGYSSSPPASPTSSIGSSLSTSPIARARAKLYRNGSGGVDWASWSDCEDSMDRLSARDYYSDRPSTASTASTASLHGLRRRATATNSVAHRKAPSLLSLPPLQDPRRQLPAESLWVPCVDPASGSTYYYNQQTGESRWDLA
jgi:hypothetical protein